MLLSAEPEDRPAPSIGLVSLPGVYCLLTTVPVVVLGLWWNGLFEWARAAASQLLF
jgi:hypothetical protein